MLTLSASSSHSGDVVTNWRTTPTPTRTQSTPRTTPLGQVAAGGAEPVASGPLRAGAREVAPGGTLMSPHCSGGVRGPSGPATGP